MISFNPHTHTGCDMLFLLGLKVLICFNPHTHTGCDWASDGNRDVLTGFNPHTHTGCDVRSVFEDTPNQSFNPHTHTGCDITKSGNTFKITVSIHTPIQGVTGVEGCEHVLDEVSIHTPIQGVTSFADCCIYSFACFNPHTHTGCDFLYQEL